MQKEIDVMIKEYKELMMITALEIEKYNGYIEIYKCIINDLEKLKVYDKEKVSKK